MERRGFLAGLTAAAITFAGGSAVAARYTTRQLIAACRLWLRRHNVRRYATVTIIPGSGPPRPVLLEPAVESGWRWAPHLSSWVSPAFNASWANGAQIPSFEAPYRGQDVQLYVGDWDTVSGVAVAAPDAAVASAFGVVRSTGTVDGSGTATASSSGSGVAFVVQGVPPSDAYNLIPNPSFENGTAGWKSTGTSSFGADTTHVFSGSKSLKCGALSGSVNGESDLFPVSPSTAYTVSFSWDSDLSMSDPILAAQALVAFYGSNRQQIAGSVNGAILHQQPLVSVTAVSPANAAFAKVGFFATNGGPTGTFWFDAFQMEEGAATPYFDGDTADDGAYAYEWTGTPHASPSRRVGAVPDPSRPADPSLTVQSLIGTEVSLDSTFTYPPEDVDGVGDPGDYWLDTTGQALYGPKADRWPDAPAVQSFKLTQLVR